MLLRLLRKGRSSNQVDDACLVHPNIWIALRGRDWFRSARGRPEAVLGRGASGGAEYGVSSKTAATEIVRRASQLTRDPAALSRFGPTGSQACQAAPFAPRKDVGATKTFRVEAVN
jgi:hypothetical protein